MENLLATNLLILTYLATLRDMTINLGFLRIDASPARTRMAPLICPNIRLPVLRDLCLTAIRPSHRLITLLPTT